MPSDAAIRKIEPTPRSASPTVPASGESLRRPLVVVDDRQGSRLASLSCMDLIEINDCGDRRRHTDSIAQDRTMNSAFDCLASSNIDAPALPETQPEQDSGTAGGLHGQGRRSAAAKARARRTATSHAPRSGRGLAAAEREREACRMERELDGSVCVLGDDEDC
jgi:hypothetical protein